MLTVADLKKLPFVQKAMQSPMQPQSVLSFFFAVDYDSQTDMERMKSGEILETMTPLWYGGGDDYDALARSFSPAIRALNKTTTSVHTSVDGVMSQVLLADQLSRNCFRRTDEAFAYDEIGRELTLKLTAEYQSRPDNGATDQFSGEFYPPYIYFLVNCLMHSEDLQHHQAGLDLIKLSLARFNDDSIGRMINSSKLYLEEHMEVLRRFGRYPHRNVNLGRTSTEEELKWLADTEALPSWAKSQ